MVTVYCRYDRGHPWKWFELCLFLLFSE